MGYPSIAEALVFSWDGSRLLIESDIAQGGPRWIVSWSTNANLMTPQDMSLADAVPLISGATMFVQDPAPPYTSYFLGSRGTLMGQVVVEDRYLNPRRATRRPPRA